MSNSVPIKVCLLGATEVGKTSIASRYVDDIFYEKLVTTSGVAFLSRYCSAPGGTLYKFHIWDTAGQERYKSLAPLYYRGASVIILVYDISRSDSLTEGVKNWVKELRANVDEDPILAVIGNKLDLAQIQRQVKEEEGRKYAETINAMFFEVSAKTGHNVANIFQKIATRLEENENTNAGPKARDLRRTDTVKFRQSTNQDSQSQKKCCLR